MKNKKANLFNHREKHNKCKQLSNKVRKKKKKTKIKKKIRNRKNNKIFGKE